MRVRMRDMALKLEASRTQQIKQQEEMRSSFLRGVSALNQEAMGLFQEDKSVPRIPYYQTPAKPKVVSFKEDAHVWAQTTTPQYVENTDGSLTTVRGLVQRHYQPSAKSVRK